MRLGRRLGAGLCVAALAAGWSDVRAAERPRDPDLDVRNMHTAGPVHYRPFFLVKDAGYDDNVIVNPFFREGDFTATAAPGVDAVLLTGDKGGIHFYQEIDYVAFRTNTDLNHWNSYTRVRGVYLLQDYALSLEDKFKSERERPNFEIDRRLRRKWNTLTAAVQTLRSGRFNARLALRRDRIQYSKDDLLFLSFDPTRLNRKEQSVSLLGEVEILPKTTLLLEGIVGRVDFEDNTAGTDSEIRSFLPGFRFDPSASLQGEIQIGVARLEAPGLPGQDYTGTVGEGNLTTRLGSRGRVKGTFLRSLEFSTLGQNLYFVFSQWDLSYEHFLTRQWSSELAYGQGRQRWPVPIVREGPFPFAGIRVDDLSFYRLKIRYRANEQFSVFAEGRYGDRISTDEIQNQDRAFYTLGLSYNF